MTATLHLSAFQGLPAASNPRGLLPAVEHLFSGSPVVLAAPHPNDDKINGSGDSAGRATIVKMPGGYDARKGLDGG